MILVIGGAYQGKRDFIKETFGLREEEIFDASEGDGHRLKRLLRQGASLRAVTSWHFVIKEQWEAGEDPKEALAALLRMHPDIILTADEIGGGLIPLAPREREYREVVGHTLIFAAREAEKVYRVLAGIGELIKGNKD